MRVRVIIGTIALLIAVPSTAATVWMFAWPSTAAKENPNLELALPPNDVRRPTVVETPQPPSPCGAALSRDYLARHQIIAYYGHPHVPAMGILGELEPEELIARVKEHAATYDSLNGDLGVRPALHMVFEVAQPQPGEEGSYLQYLGRGTVKKYIDLACRHGLLIFLDLQIGRSNVGAEVKKVLPYLEREHVQLALDPEFAMPPGEVPGETIGTLDADDINAAQEMVQALVDEHGIANKLIVVHRFTDRMITRSELIKDYPRVGLVIDMDGFGPAEVKRVKYGWYARPPEYAGIKLFFRQDTDLLSEADVLALEPDVIIYQ